MNRSSRNIPIIRLIPNIITFFGICVGLHALRLGLNGNISLAILFLLLAMVLDVLDGKIARAIQSESKIGAELDSLADFFNFGVVAPLIVYFTVLVNSSASSLGWLAVMTMSICCAFRLARFNVVGAEKDPNEGVDAYFSGVPAPMVASLAMCPLYMAMLEIDVTENYPYLAAGFLVFCGILAVCTFPTVSIKVVSVPEKYQFLLILLLVLTLVFIVVYPWHTLLAINATYLLYLPIYVFSVKRNEKIPNK